MCCGATGAGIGQRPARIDAGEPDASVRFTYIGPASLAIAGGVTRTLYRFESGATLDVDRRDAYGLAALPMLRRAAD